MPILIAYKLLPKSCICLKFIALNISLNYNSFLPVKKFRLFCDEILK